MTLLQMSLSGALMILTVALIRALAMHRLPKRLFPALWGVVLARLLIPFSLPSPLSLFRLLRPATDAAPVANPAAAPVAETVAAWTAVPAGGGATAAAIDAVPDVAARDFALSGVDPWRAVWLIGLALTALYFLFGYALHRRRFRESLPVSCEFVRAWLAAHPLRRRVQARQTDRIAAPLTYGVLRPVILLPSRTDWADEGALDYVLAHEWTHIRRNDALFKPLLIVAACVHWFNPLAWAMLALANRDLELACDEQVVLSRGRDSRRSYALALIRMEERMHGPSPLYSHFSRTAIEERITAIMKTGNRSRIATALALLMMLSAFTAFATSAPQPSAAGASSGEPLPTPVPTFLAGSGSSDEPMSTQMPAFTAGSGSSDEPLPTPVPTFLAGIGSSDEPISTQMPAFTAGASVPDAPSLNAADYWTIPAYADRMMAECQRMQALVDSGAMGYDEETGPFLWTQAQLDARMAPYEQTLSALRDGVLLPVGMETLPQPADAAVAETPEPTETPAADGAPDARLSVVCRPGESVGYAGDEAVRIDVEAPEHDSYFFLLTVSNGGDAARQVRVDRISPLFPQGLTFSVGPGAWQSALYLGDLDAEPLPLTLRSSGGGWDFWPTLRRVHWLDDLNADLSGSNGSTYAVSIPEATGMRFTYRATDGSPVCLYSDADPEWRPVIRPQDDGTEADVTLEIPAGNLIICFSGNGLLSRR